METGSFCAKEKLATFVREGFTTPNTLKIAIWFTFTTELLDFTCRREAHTTLSGTPLKSRKTSDTRARPATGAARTGQSQPDHRKDARGDPGAGGTARSP